jgi:UTP:GlnB (protein PII) uridylyltransferase
VNENLPEREIANKSGWHFKNYCYFCIWIDNKMMDKQIFDSIRRLKRELIPNERLILFGSQARGDASPDSDWDLLLLVKNGENKKDLEDKIFAFVLMGWNYGTYLSIKSYAENEWDAHPSLLKYNIENEGIEIV